jgi:hypothetical protein
MGKLNKRVTIARSGVYKYSAGALAGLGLSLPPEKQGQQSFGVFRPKEVLRKNKDKFSRLPLTLNHPPTFVTGDNFRDLVQGYTGDSVEAREENDTVFLDSTVTIYDSEAVNAYWRGIVEVSPGYKGKFSWESGVSPQGEAYDIVMDDITEVNHLALTREGRGGPSACVFDSREVLVKPKKSGLFYAIRKRMKGVEDSGKDGIYARVSDLVEQRLTLSEEDIGKRIASILDDVDYLPDSADKSQLVAFVEDFSGIVSESDDVAKQAVLVVGNLFSRLDSEALAQVSLVLDAEDKKEEPEGSAPKTEESEAPSEDKSGEPPEPKAEGEGDSPLEEKKEEPASPSALDEPHVGLDDAILDKKESELTPEECEYLHQKLMEMLKDYLVGKTPAGTPPPGDAPGAPGPVDGEQKPGEGEPGHEESETPAEEKKEGEEKPEEEKKEKDEKVEDAVEHDPVDLMPPMPLADESASIQGIDLEAQFRRLKGAK